MLKSKRGNMANREQFILFHETEHILHTTIAYHSSLYLLCPPKDLVRSTTIICVEQVSNKLPLGLDPMFFTPWDTLWQDL